MSCRLRRGGVKFRVEVFVELLPVGDAPTAQRAAVDIVKVVAPVSPEDRRVPAEGIGAPGVITTMGEQDLGAAQPDAKRWRPEANFGGPTVRMLLLVQGLLGTPSLTAGTCKCDAEGPGEPQRAPAIGIASATGK